MDARALLWLVNAFHFDGLLHWGLNQWGGDSSLRPIARLEVLHEARGTSRVSFLVSRRVNTPEP